MGALSDSNTPERIFRFKRFSVSHSGSALKLGTDAVLLGAAMTVPEGPGTKRLLDIGTGCGVIALMAAQRCPAATVTGIDIDGPSALEAERNFQASPWSGRLEAKHCPLQDFKPDAGYDLIFSNPPYFDKSPVNPDIRKGAARHNLALSCNDIFAFASVNLVHGGRLSLILPAEAEKQTLRQAASYGITLDRTVRISTVSGKAPKRIIVEFIKGITTAVGAKEETLCLYSAGTARSRAYSELCAEFYL